MPRIDMKNKILDVYLKLIDERDFDDIIVSEIVREAHISRQTFYNHFKDTFNVLEYALIEKMHNNYSIYEEGAYLKDYLYNVINDIYVNRKIILKIKNSKYYSIIESLLIKTYKDEANMLMKKSKKKYSEKEFNFYLDLFCAGFGTYVSTKCEDDDLDIDDLVDLFAGAYHKLFGIPLNVKLFV